MELTPLELKNVKTKAVKCIGKIFIDDEDVDDIHTGLVESVVMHKQSNTLAFRYYDHNTHDTKPARKSDFEYLDVDYAMKHCKWSQESKLMAATAQIEILDTYLNRGPTRNQKQNLRRRKKEPAPWYHGLIIKCRNAALTINRGQSAHFRGNNT